MRGTDIRRITLPMTDWCDIFDVLIERKNWDRTAKEIEKQCQGQQEQSTVRLMQARYWATSHEIRPTHPEIADRVALQLGMVDLW